MVPFTLPLDLDSMCVCVCIYIYIYTHIYIILYSYSSIVMLEWNMREFGESLHTQRSCQESEQPAEAKISSLKTPTWQTLSHLFTPMQSFFSLVMTYIHTMLVLQCSQGLHPYIFYASGIMPTHCSFSVGHSLHPRTFLSLRYHNYACFFWQSLCWFYVWPDVSVGFTAGQGNILELLPSKTESVRY